MVEVEYKNGKIERVLGIYTKLLNGYCQSRFIVQSDILWSFYRKMEQNIISGGDRDDL